MRTLYITIILFTLFSLSATATCNPTCVNGTCLDGNACSCNDGWSGKLCDQPTCSPACGNGTCSAPNTCNCSFGYTGSLCKEITCDYYGCENGECVGPATCNCTTGWAGPGCTIAVCEPGCQNGGACIAPNVCNCDYSSGWNGDYCQNPICNSTLGECQHGTTCVGAGVCNCTGSGYAGTVCSADVNECLLPNTTACDPLTTCTNTVGSYLCSACPTNYVGDGKTGCYAECAYGCSNGGVCSGPATCNCTGTGFTGDQCFYDLDECEVGGYCSTLVTCTNTIGSYECGACPTGYNGTGYINQTGCTAFCSSGCPSGEVCLSPDVCGVNSGLMLVAGLLPLMMIALMLM